MLIETKFDLGQKVYLKESLAYFIDTPKGRVIRGIVIGFLVSRDLILYELDHNGRYIGKFYEDDLFATKEDALAKLKELGEKK